MTVTVEPTADEERARTMAVRALRRLSSTELGGLGIALEMIERLEHDYLAGLPEMKAGVIKERRYRQVNGLAGPGSYEAAYTAHLYLIRALTEAREVTEQTRASGRVARRRAPRLDG